MTIPAEITGRDLLEFVAPEFREKVAGYVRARSRGERVDVRYESMGERKDGSRFPYEISVAVIGLSDGPVTMAFITDISERKAAEEALKKSGDRLKRAEQIAGIGHWEFNMGSGTVQASDGARAIYGLSGEQWTIPEVQKIPLPEYRPLLDEALRALIHEGRPYDVEFRIRRPSDNALLDIHSTAEYEPGTNTVFGIIRDITLQKKAEVTLRESENKYRGIVETTPDLIWEIDVTGRFTFMSPRISDLLGYPAEGLLGKSFISLLPPDQVPVAGALFEKQVSTGQDLVTLEIIAQHADGRRIEMEIRSAPATDDQGRITGFRGITRDITEARRAATSLEQARKKMNLLNSVTFQDIQSAAFSLHAYHVLMNQLRPDDKDLFVSRKRDGPHPENYQLTEFCQKLPGDGYPSAPLAECQPDRSLRHLAPGFLIDRPHPRYRRPGTVCRSASGECLFQPHGKCHQAREDGNGSPGMVPGETGRAYPLHR